MNRLVPGTEETSRGSPMPTLAVNPDTVHRLMELAREFHTQDWVEVPDDPISLEDIEPDILSSYSGDPILGEFRSIIEDLDQDQQVQVVALMWLGRGDYEPDEWESLLQDADDAWTDYTADYLLAHPLLADHLREGLDLLDYQDD